MVHVIVQEGGRVEQDYSFQSTSNQLDYGKDGGVREKCSMAELHSAACG